ncbi:steryl-sulfatase-like [Ptychodera flava]|uniref:steryl-sulfatase-like n=1 Tax=Ptychodera flava TaxID=63121 RepID=UPI00396A2ADE
MKVTVISVLLVLIGGCAQPSLAQPQTKSKKPNFVLLMVDDLGMGDVGCYGNDTIRTPNMDSIAKQGVKLSQHVVPAPLCTPSRAAFITGRHPIRSGMLAYGRLRMVPFLAATAGLPSNETTFAESLKDVGYRTALIGKWHMGMHCSHSKDYCHHPLQQGFDYFYGLPLTNLRDCGEDTSRSVVTAWCPVFYENIGWSVILTVSFIFVLLKLGFVKKRGFITLIVASFIFFALPIIITKGVRVMNCVLMRNYEVVEQPIQLENVTLRLTKEATQFIEQSQSEPFVLFMSYVKVHTALFSSAKFKGISRHGRMGIILKKPTGALGKYCLLWRNWV